MRSLQRLLNRDDEIYWPCHGGPIKHPRSFVRAFIAHREAREQQVLNCLREGPQSIQSMLPSIYADLSPTLFPAAERSVLATLVFLIEKGQVRSQSSTMSNAMYSLQE